MLSIRDAIRTKSNSKWLKLLLIIVALVKTPFEIIELIYIGIKKTFSFFIFLNRKATQTRSFRWIILLVIAFIMGICLVQYWERLMDFLKTYDKIPASLITALVASPFAFWLWVWRDQNKIKDQEHIERKLIIEENNDAWENFFKFQKLALDEDEPPLVRSTAIYALGEYYTRPKESNFPQQVHNFYQSFLDCYWMEYNNNKLELSPYIAAVYSVIVSKKDFHIKYKLSLANFNLVRANFMNIDMRGAFLFNANLTKADFRIANLRDVKFLCANLKGADLRGADLRGADFHGVNFEGATLCGAKYNKMTLFDNNFDPKKAGMKKVDD